MDQEVAKIYRKIIGAEYPEDIFGELVATEQNEQRSEVNKIFRNYAKLLHPDRYEDGTEEFRMAQEAFPILSEFNDKAQAKIEKGRYGNRELDNSEDEIIDFVITTRKYEYHLRKTIAEGDLSIVYGGDYIDEQGNENKVVVKVIQDPADNDLAQNEARVLRLLNGEPNNYSKHLPKLLDQFKTSEGQMANILSYCEGYDLYAVREKYKDGVEPKHMVWMLNRLLSVLGYAHSKGVVHCNIEPAHIMIRPQDHNLYLIDWSYAAINPFKTGDGFKILNEDYSPPEVAEKKRPLPASDMYAVGKTMIYLLGGDVKGKKIPAATPDKLSRMIQVFVRESPLQRAQDAWEMHTHLRKTVEELWGPRKFILFEM